MSHLPDPQRYDRQPYRRSGRSGLLLPTVSLGLWHNFGAVDRHDTARDMILGAFDRGITHFDLANNYGPPPGSAEVTMGRVLREDLHAHRDELLISTKAGYRMAPGPYGEWGSRKALISSLDASLKRLGLPYVDIFYSHRPDPDTPLEETMAALDHAVRSGRALYAGLSNYGAEATRQASAILRRLGTPCVIHQPRYSLLDRWVEAGLLSTLADEGIGCIAFSPLAQGLLTERYLAATLPADSRAAKGGFLTPADITAGRLAVVRQLKTLADARSQTLPQLALSWVLRKRTGNTSFSEQTLATVPAALVGLHVDRSPGNTSLRSKEDDPRDGQDEKRQCASHTSPTNSDVFVKQVRRDPRREKSVHHVHCHARLEPVEPGVN